MASFDNQQQLSGLAGQLRAATESDQYDLAGYTEQRIRDLVTASFSSPLTAPNKMIKFTFIVGGGKSVRSKYDEDLCKWFNTILRDIGFSEDKSAAETYDSQGTFKRQHDTGANLIYMIVYPRVTCATAQNNNNNNNNTQNNTTESETIDTTSPEYIITSCELATLKDITAKKLGSWRQMKKALKILLDGAELFQSIEQKLCGGNQLSVKEQAIYESNSGVDNDKIAWIQVEIKKMVDDCQLTASEKEECLKTMDDNLKSVTEEISKAENKPKLIAKLEEKKNSIQARKTALMGKPPIVRRLKYGDEIVKLRMKIFPLIALEDKGRAMKLTIEDLTKISEKTDIEENVRQYETASKGWFMNEEDFSLMCQAEEKTALEKYKATKKSVSSSIAKKPSSSTSKSTNAWSTASKSKSVNLSNIGKSSAAPKASNSFSAFANDDDSDDD